MQEYFSWITLLLFSLLCLIGFVLCQRWSMSICPLMSAKESLSYFHFGNTETFSNQSINDKHWRVSLTHSLTQSQCTFGWDSQRDSDSSECRFLTQSLCTECRNLNICLCFEGTKGKIRIKNSQIKDIFVRHKIINLIFHWFTVDAFLFLKNQRKKCS